MQDGSVSPIKAFFLNKWVWLILAIDIAAIILIIIISVNKATETAIINFNVTPVDATITINGRDGYENYGQPIEGNKNSDRSYSLKPGTYEIQISHPDLDTKTFNLNLESNTNTTVTTFLSKDGDFYFYTLRDNLSSFNRLTSIASAKDNQTIDQDTSAEAFILQQERKDSITKLTPIRFAICGEPASRVNCNAIEVTYDYSEKCDNQRCLIIKGRADELFNDVINELANQLEVKGYNLKNYRYIYEQDTRI